MFYNGDLLCKSINYVISRNYKIALTKLNVYIHSNWAQALKRKNPLGLLTSKPKFKIELKS